MDTLKIADVFDRAAADFVRLAPHPWNPIGQACVDLAGIQPGDRVLDACCGAGGSVPPRWWGHE
ncbi:hypothetical protein ACFXJ8_38755 [Nonomuraea sp. NPDC059194]|uniref:hypothetical protein n=1 Tax=Nonomuraea sp. NPDC059194 TaxID=3346764 RepID=UPI0036AF1560